MDPSVLTALLDSGSRPLRDGRVAGEVLDLLAAKWSVETLLVLEGGRRRHGEVLRELGGSKKVVTHALRRLERDGLVRRDVFAEVPPRVEYSLTDLGRSLVEPLRALIEWGERNLEPVGSARAWHDASVAAAARGA